MKQLTHEQKKKYNRGAALERSIKDTRKNLIQSYSRETAPFVLMLLQNDKRMFGPYRVKTENSGLLLISSVYKEY